MKESTQRNRSTGDIKDKQWFLEIKLDLLQGWGNTRKMSSAYTYVSQALPAQQQGKEGEHDCGTWRVSDLLWARAEVITFKIWIIRRKGPWDRHPTQSLHRVALDVKCTQYVMEESKEVSREGLDIYRQTALEDTESYYAPKCSMRNNNNATSQINSHKSRAPSCFLNLYKYYTCYNAWHRQTKGHNGSRFVFLARSQIYILDHKLPSTGRQTNDKYTYASFFMLQPLWQCRQDPGRKGFEENKKIHNDIIQSNRSQNIQGLKLVRQNKTFVLLPFCYVAMGICVCKETCFL